MGTIVHHRYADFTILAEQIEAALEALKTLAQEENVVPAHSSDNVHEEWQSLGDALVDWGWNPWYDEDGNINDIEWPAAQKVHGWQDALWDTIAEYVETGSYIELECNGEQYRYVFGETEAEVVEPEVSWPDPFAKA